MVCRDPVAGERVRQELIAESQNPNIKLHLVDLSRPGQIKAFCQSFIAAKETEAIDILVNNAGVLLNSRQVTDGEGLEKAFATNTLGTYFMTTLLIPALHKSKDPRVITVSSGGMYNAALDLSDLQFTQGKYDGSIAYAQTKVRFPIDTYQND